MSLINYLTAIAQKQPKPNCLVVYGHQVGTLVAHIAISAGVPQNQAREHLLAGRICILNVPVKVVGASMTEAPDVLPPLHQTKH